MSKEENVEFCLLTETSHGEFYDEIQEPEKFCPRCGKKVAECTCGYCKHK